MSTITNPYAPPKAAVRDIYTADASLVYADRGTRLGAALLDGIIAAIMVYAPMFVVIMFASVTSEGGLEGAPTGLVLAGIGLSIVGLVAWLWLTTLYVYRNGQTIAKKILKIKVVRSDGSPASLGRIFWLRNFVNGLLGIIPLYGIVELLFIFGESQQCLHDKMADTIVVKE